MWLGLDMYEVGEQMVRSRLRREHRGWSEEQVEAAVDRCRLHRPGEVEGDVPAQSRNVPPDLASEGPRHVVADDGVTAGAVG